MNRPSDHDIADVIRSFHHLVMQMPTGIDELLDLDEEYMDECFYPVVDWARRVDS